MNEFTQNPWNPSPWLLKHSERRKKWRKKHQTWSPMWTSPFTHVNSRCELSLLIVKTTYQTYHITWNIPERWEKVVPTTNTSWWSHTKYGILCHIVLNVTMVTFRMALSMNKWKNVVRMMNEFIYWPKPNLLLSTTSNGMLSHMIEIWMKNDLVSDNNCNVVVL